MDENIEGQHVGPIANISVGDQVFDSPRDALAALRKVREQQQQPAEPPPAPAVPPAQESEPPQAADDASPTEATGEQATEEAGPAEELPPVEPPRSWTKEERERFATFPRETQEYLVQREQDRERAFLQRQNEVAEQRKVFETKQSEVERARQQYEALLPQMQQALQAQMSGEFADIKTWDDVHKLAAEDPFRFGRWQVAQQQRTAVEAEMKNAQERQARERAEKWAQFAEAEGKRFDEKVPEMRDPARAKALRESAERVLKSVGFTPEELAVAYRGETGIPVLDHRVQLLVHKAALWDEAQARKTQVVKAPLPPVQRPGTARPAGADRQSEIESLTKELSQATGLHALRVATKLQQAKRGR